MSNYGRITTRGSYSENSDGSMPSVDTKADTLDLTPTTYLHQRLHLSTSETTLDLSGFTTITGLIVVNHGTAATEIVLAKWLSQVYVRAATAAPNDLYFDATLDVIYENTATSFLTRGAPEAGIVVVSSAEDAGNDKSYAYLITTTLGTEVLKVGTTEVATTNTNDAAAVLTFYGVNAQAIAPIGGQLVLTSNVQVSSDLVLRAAVGTPEVEVFVLGT